LSPEQLQALLSPGPPTLNGGRAAPGLHLAKGIIQAHGGRLWAEGTLDGSTALAFAIPRG
jgi:signal transduction histidine kinase